jgi:hypothetical protein
LDILRIPMREVRLLRNLDRLRSLKMLVMAALKIIFSMIV